jgi:hypothetical protein
MATRVLFRCERCAAAPDAATQRTLMAELRDRTPGEYVDAQPGGWLIWTGGGALGPKRYACRRHRDAFVEALRAQYGASRRAIWRGEPDRSLWPDGLSGLRDRELTELLGRSAVDASGPAAVRPRGAATTER